LLPARDIDRAGVAAGLAPNAAFERLNEGLPERPIVVLRKELLQAIEELPNESLLFILGLRSWKTQSRNPIEATLILFLLFLRKWRIWRCGIGLVQRRRKSHEILSPHRDQGLLGPQAHVL